MMKTDCVHFSDVVLVEALRDAKRSHPQAAFWIKADACDVLPGIQESVNHEWAGDVDLNDGAVRARTSTAKLRQGLYFRSRETARVLPCC